ncbi:hypothetical protein BGW39_007617 [Mortierella sp. 14UC]|nr:hypothetical protein BGW39_007617 [Mortierella sp. 14UC]
MFDCFNTEEFHKSLEHISSHVRILETTDASFATLVTSLHPAMTKLQSLSLHLKDEPISLTKIFPSEVKDGEGEISTRYGSAAPTVRLLLNNRNLGSISLNESCFRQEPGEDTFSLVVSTMYPERLERLELLFFDPGENEEVVEEENHLRIGGIERHAHLCTNSDLEFESLRELVIAGAHNKPMDGTRLAFLARWTQLESIRLYHLDLVAMAVLQALLRKFLRLPNMTLFGPLAFKALLESSETLEEFCIKGCPRLASSSFWELLCSTRNLRRLEGVAEGQRRDRSTGPTVHALDAYMTHVKEHEEVEVDNGDKKEMTSGGSWVLGPSMEYFQLHIKDVP